MKKQRYTTKEARERAEVLLNYNMGQIHLTPTEKGICTKIKNSRVLLCKSDKLIIEGIYYKYFNI